MRRVFGLIEDQVHGTAAASRHCGDQQRALTRSQVPARATSAALNGIAQSLCLERQVSLVKPPSQPRDQPTEHAGEPNRQCDSGPPPRRLDPVLTRHAHAGAPRDPTEAAPWLQLRHLPRRRRQPGLPDPYPVPDRQWTPVEPLDPGDSRSPFRPALDIGHDRPDPVRRRGNLDGDAEVRWFRAQTATLRFSTRVLKDVELAQSRPLTKVR